MSEKGTEEVPPGLVSAAPMAGGFRLSEEINPRWLWLVTLLGLTLVVLALLLDLVWSMSNILPNASLSLGVGTMLFALLFLAERRIVRRTSVVWVSALEEFAAQVGQDPAELEAHFSGPVALAHEFVSAILDRGDYGRAWALSDENWRLCRAQAWLWNNRDHPLISSFDRDDAAHELAKPASTHELWPDFARTELEQFSGVWSDPDLTAYGAASATRRVDDGEIVLLVDLSEHPRGAVAHGPTEIVGVSFLVREIDGKWRLANLVGDHLPVPRWPPDWKEGWTYWDRVLQKNE